MALHPGVDKLESAPAKKTFSRVKAIAIDVDGVLTDGKLHIDHTGEKLFKSFHTRDIRSIRELVAKGYEVYLVSADDSNFGKVFAEKVGAVFIYLRDKSKAAEAIGVPYIAVGDDAWDVPMLKAAVAAYCPIDADWSVLNIVPDKNVIPVPGGRGVIASLLLMLEGKI